MKLKTISGNTLREVETKVNELGIPKEDIINIMQDRDGLFIVNYFGED